MILVVTLNLAVDAVVEVQGLAPGGVHRARSVRRAAGGKGVNVARVLRTLGEPCAVAGLVGGATGRAIARGLKDEGIDLLATRIAGESRTCVILDDPAAGVQTVVNEPGPRVLSSELERFHSRYRRALRQASFVVLSGSLPPGVPVDVAAELVRLARAAGVATIVDCTGDAARAALAEGPAVLKVNADEAAEITGEEGDSALALARLGAEVAAVTRGERGAEIVAGDVRLEAVPPRIEARNAVGSGDAAAAGLAAGLARALPLEETVRLAVAAGAASALHGFGHCSLEEIESIRARVVVRTSKICGE